MKKLLAVALITTLALPVFSASAFALTMGTLFRVR